jgi:hypothetical protein
MLCVMPSQRSDALTIEKEGTATPALFVSDPTYISLVAAGYEVVRHVKSTIWGFPASVVPRIMCLSDPAR